MSISISQRIKVKARCHLFDNTPIYELGLEKPDCDRIERVGYVMRLKAKQPDTDAFDVFKRIAAGRYDSAMDDWREARKDKILFDFLMTEQTDANKHHDKT